MVLETPRAADDLYLARSIGTDVVSVLRPVMTGDVFARVEIPGVGKIDGDGDKLAMVVSHPCSMREGHRLREHVQAVRVLRQPPIPLGMWAKGHFDRMPLPELTVAVDELDEAELTEDERLARIDDGAHAAVFDLRGRVATASLELSSRVACLTELGVAHLHQRMGHHDTRHAPAVEQLMAACEPVFTEVELWETWNEHLVGPPVVGDASRLAAELERVAELFHAVLSERRQVPGKKDGRYVLRHDLSIRKTQAHARREVHKLLMQAKLEQAQAG